MIQPLQGCDNQYSKDADGEDGIKREASTEEMDSRASKAQSMVVLRNKSHRRNKVRMI